MELNNYGWMKAIIGKPNRNDGVGVAITNGIVGAIAKMRVPFSSICKISWVSSNPHSTRLYEVIIASYRGMV